MAASDPTDAIQAGLYTVLSGDAALSLLVTGVYDGVPETVSPAYVIIGETLTAPDGVHGTEGRQTAATIHTWTRTPGFKSANAIGARVVALLWHQHAALDTVVTGHTVWRVEHEFSQTLTDPEPLVRHRVDRFRIWTFQG
jgi:energy-converting hydrogenase Eha subunit B